MIPMPLAAAGFFICAVALAWGLLTWLTRR